MIEVFNGDWESISRNAQLKLVISFPEIEDGARYLVSLRNGCLVASIVGDKLDVPKKGLGRVLFKLVLDDDWIMFTKDNKYFLVAAIFLVQFAQPPAYDAPAFVLLPDRTISNARNECLDKTRVVIDLMGDCLHNSDMRVLLREHSLRVILNVDFGLDSIGRVDFLALLIWGRGERGSQSVLDYTLQQWLWNDAFLIYDAICLADVVRSDQTGWGEQNQRID